MTNAISEGFINKRDAVELFNRSHRSLSRDITTAVRLREEKVLRHFRLQTQDGQVREGTEVTIELLDQLREEGQVPTWWAERGYLRQRYGLRGEKPADRTADNDVLPTNNPATQATEKAQPSETIAGTDKPALPSDPEIRATVLEHLHNNDQQHARDTKEMMDRILQLIETNQQLQSQTNTLFNQFQEALKEGGGLGKLIAASTAKAATPPPQPLTPDERKVTDAKIVDADSLNESREPTRKRSSPKASGAPAKRKRSTTKNSTTKKPKPKSPKTPMKPEPLTLRGRLSRIARTKLF